MPRHLIEPHDHNDRSLSSGTAVTPSTDHPTFVVVNLEATGIGSSDSGWFSIDVQDSGGTSLSGYPVTVRHERGSTTSGEVDRNFVVSFIVPTNGKYVVTDNSSGAATTSMSAIEDRL